MTDPDARCDLTDLLVTACACSRHRGSDRDTPLDREVAGHPFTALYPGHCGACGGAITPGNTIVRLADSHGYAHERCV